jgi:DNA-binding transcriptional regulator YbjK
VTPDGRRMRGERARTTLLEAALRIIERDGVAGVTHRRVCREAGLPASSAAYHFDSINQLLEAALVHGDQQCHESLMRIAAADDPLTTLAYWLADDFETERPRLIAEYELFLYAARTPSLRPAALRWLTELDELVTANTGSREASRAICAYVDGLLIQSLVTGEQPSGDTILTTIDALSGRRVARSSVE